VPALPDEVRAAHLHGAALALVAGRPAVQPGVPNGWRTWADAVETVVLRDDTTAEVEVRSTRTGTTVAIDGADPLLAVLHAWDGRHADVEVDGLRRRVAVQAEPEDDEHARSVLVSAGGWTTAWTQPARLPAGEASEQARGPSSPVPGTVVAVHVAAGDRVSAGDALVVLEAMKMEHRITADTDASVVEVVVAVGDAVDAHEVLVVLEPLGVGEDAHADH
jgi:propionyl-CoA carboxylase alpha chain